MAVVVVAVEEEAAIAVVEAAAVADTKDCERKKTQAFGLRLELFC
jgi:hypothetical protein